MVLIGMTSWCETSEVPRLKRRTNLQLFINLDKFSIKVKGGGEKLYT